MSDPLASRPLTPKQKTWAEHYANHGNGTLAAKQAGYRGTENVLAQVSCENLKKPQIIAHLATLTQPGTNSRIADAVERQEFWSSVIRDKDEAMPMRLKASELLGKRQGDFVDRLALTGADGGAVKLDVEHSLEGKTLEELAALYKSWG
jgi:phage terminase small subunit